MHADVQHWCRSCHNCQVNGNKRLLYGPRQAVIANGPFEKWGIDAMEPLPRTANGKLYILIAIDYMTRFGAPLEIVFDNGPGFRKGLSTKVCEELKISHRHSTPYYPQSNGLVEKANGIIAGIIRKMVEKSSFDLEKEPKGDVVGTSSILLSLSVGASRKSLRRKFLKEEPKPELDTKFFDTQLALSSTSNNIPLLLISELFESLSFRFAFEGKVLCKYGTYKIIDNAYPNFLKADLIDKEGSHTITFVVVDAYIPQLVECFQVDDYVHIEGVSIKQRVKTD
ncbi:hypothetical protein L7F22_003336 [Adiantum nelumboides]|nr:hypothetical protein [Adiantum nelumboides]